MSLPQRWRGQWQRAWYSGEGSPASCSTAHGAGVSTAVLAGAGVLTSSSSSGLRKVCCAREAHTVHCESAAGGAGGTHHVMLSVEREATWRRARHRYSAEGRHRAILRSQLLSPRSVCGAGWDAVRSYHGHRLHAGKEGLRRRARRPVAERRHLEEARRQGGRRRLWPGTAGGEGRRGY